MKLLMESWRTFLNEKLMLKPGENGWDKYLQLVGQAYMDAPDEQPEAVASYEALGEWVNKFFERIVGVVDVEFVDYHPYKSSKEMIQRVQDEGVLKWWVKFLAFISMVNQIAHRKWSSSMTSTM